MKWTKEQIQTLRYMHIKKRPYEEIAKVLGTTKGAVAGKIYRDGRAKPSKQKGKSKSRSVESAFLRRPSMTNDPVIIAIELERIARGETIEALSTRAGYSTQLWSHVVCGRANPSYNCVSDYAEALGMKLEVRAA